MNIFSNITTKKAETTAAGSRVYVRNFGNIAEEYNALRTGAILYDCGDYGIFEVTGDDASDYLESLSTKDVSFMNISAITESCFLNDDAEMICPAFIVKKEDKYIVITFWEFADAAYKWMQSAADGFSVEVKDISPDVSLLTVEGCCSWKIIKSVFDTEIENIALQTVQDISYKDSEVSIMRIGRTSEYAYMILGNTAAGSSVYSDVLSCGSECDFPVCEGGFDCIEAAMLEVHQPNFIRESGKFGNIFELSQQWYIHHDKEDYHGFEKIREIIENGIEKSAVCFISEDADVIEPGTAVMDEENNEAGKVVYSLLAPKFGKALGIAVLNDPYGQPNLTFTAGTKKIETVSSPVVRPLSWDMKME